MDRQYRFQHTDGLERATVKALVPITYTPRAEVPENDVVYLQRMHDIADGIAHTVGLESERQAALLRIYAGQDLSPCLVCPRNCVGMIPFGECEAPLKRISEAWDVSPGTISTYMRRLRENLERNGVTV